MFIPHPIFENISANFEGQVKGLKKFVLKGSLSNTRHIYYTVQGVKKSGHRIVWECFCGKIPEGLEINHKDGNKQNNCLSNLELVTHAENMQHAHTNGLIIVPKGENHTSAKLDAEKVNEILSLFEKGFSQGKIAKLFKVHQGSISDIVNNRSWKHIPRTFNDYPVD